MSLRDDVAPEVTFESTTTFVTPARGLSAAQVAEREAAGLTNDPGRREGRTFGQIVRANVFTPINAILSVLLAVILATGRWTNALFGFVILSNSVIGIIQELQSRRVLDKLAVLNQQPVAVVRESEVVLLDSDRVVLDELIQVKSGDQVPADGLIQGADGLEVDESLLTGESDPVPKQPGDAMKSGSIVVAGQGRFQATAVGADSYAARVTADAQRFSLTHSELRAGTDRLLKVIALIMVVVAPLIVWRQFASPDNPGWREAIIGSVAALVGMVPDGLVLLTSMAFAVGVIQMARRKTLVQELPAIEGLARVDMLCLDKTGTLTHGDIALDRVEPLSDAHPAAAAQVAEALSLLAADTTNATAVAIGSAYPPGSWTTIATMPFSSARKWSAVTAAGEGGTWVMGAPEMVLPAGGPARAEADLIAATGARVLLLARTDAGLNAELLPEGLQPVALVVLAERLREDAAETLRFFAEQGVGIKVISGDNPRTVGAVALRVGVPGITRAEEAVDARSLPEDPEALADAVAHGQVFGRVTPAQKRAMVGALQSRGHVVAMTGDGVNDALALKDADVGVAMGSGSPATRAVAQLVLLDGQFSHLPEAVAEGRRVIANIERAASLFLIRNVYATTLALITAATAMAFPFKPIQMTLIASLTIGIPGFFLALGPNRRRYLPGFLRRVIRFSVPVGVVIGLCTFAGYYATRWLEPDAGVDADRTTATIVVLIICMWTLTLVARPWRPWKIALVGAMTAAGAVILATPALAHGIFALDLTWQRVAVGVAIAVVGSVIVTVLRALAIRQPSLEA